MKNALHKRCREQMNLHIDLKKKIQFIRCRCNGITWFLLYKSIQRNVKKEESNILKSHLKKLRNLTRNRMLPFDPYDLVTNLSKYQLKVDKMDLLKNDFEFSIPPKFLKKTDVFCQFDMIAKFMTQELDDNQTSTQLKNELPQMDNSYVYKYRPSFNSLRKHKVLLKLKYNKDIVITHPDKGNGEYIKSMTELISDQKKFRKLKEDPTLKRERALQRTLREIEKIYIYLVILNIQTCILKVINQLDWVTVELFQFCS